MRLSHLLWIGEYRPRVTLSRAANHPAVALPVALFIVVRAGSTHQHPRMMSKREGSHATHATHAKRSNSDCGHMYKRHGGNHVKRQYNAKIWDSMPDEGEPSAPQKTPYYPPPHLLQACKATLPPIAPPAVLRFLAPSAPAPSALPALDPLPIPCRSACPVPMMHSRARMPMHP